MCKLITCPTCNDIVNLTKEYNRSCFCGKCKGRYLDDNVTAIVNKDAIVVGIDNNGFRLSKELYVMNKEHPSRLDFFFTGWIPTKPGEVIVVDTVEDVSRYDNHVKDPEYISTSPTEF